MSLNIESHNTRRSLTFDRSFRKETVYLDTRIFVLLLFQKGFLSLSIYIYIDPVRSTSYWNRLYIRGSQKKNLICSVKLNYFKREN